MPPPRMVSRRDLRERMAVGAQNTEQPGRAQPPVPVNSSGEEYRSFDFATRELRRRLNAADEDARRRIPLRVSLPLLFGVSPLLWLGIGSLAGLF